MKRKIKFVTALLTVWPAYGNVLRACEVCKSKQPRLLEGITHGPGPDGNLDFFITGTAIAIVIITLVAAAWLLIKPGEKDPKHIKNIIIDQNP